MTLRKNSKKACKRAEGEALKRRFSALAFRSVSEKMQLLPVKRLLETNHACTCRYMHPGKQ